MKKTGKRLLVWLMTLSILVTLIPQEAFAAGEEDQSEEMCTVTFYANSEYAQVIYFDEYGNQYESDSYSMQIPVGEEINLYSHVGLSTTPPISAILGFSTDLGATEPDENITAYDGLELYGVYEYGAELPEYYTVTLEANNDNAEFIWWEDGEECRGKERVLTDYSSGSILSGDITGGLEYETVITGRFLGWSLDPEATEPEEIEINGDVKAYAVWEQPFKITFHANGGYFEDGSDVLIQERNWGEDADLTVTPLNENPNAVFLGWFENEDEESECTYYPVYDDLELYAHWLEVDAVPLSVGETATLSTDDYEGYFVFTPETTGYYLLELTENEDSSFYICLYDKNLNDLYINGNRSLGCELTGGETYYYKINDEWNSSFTCEGTLSLQETITVTYHTEEPGTYLEGEETVVSTKVIANKEFSPYCNYWSDDTCDKIFIGWSQNKDAEVPEKSVYAGSEDIDLYAIWADTCAVTFHADAEENPTAYYENEVYNSETEEWESVRSETRERTYGKGAQVSPWADSPEYDYSDWEFNGWSIDPDATEADEKIIASDGLQLYATWREKYVTVTYDANGGYLLDDDDNEVSSIETKIWRGDGFSVLGSPYHKDDTMMFVGWFTEKDGGEQVRSWECEANEDMTLYAHWNEIKVTPIELNEEFSCNGEEAPVYFSFTVTEDGIYRVAEADRHYYQYDIYDENFSLIAETYDSYYIEAELKPGDYYLRIYGSEYEDSSAYIYGTFTLTMLDTVIVTYHSGGEGTYFYTEERYDPETDDYVTVYITEKTSRIPEGELVSDYEPNRPGNEDSEKMFAGWAAESNAELPDNDLIATGNMDVYAVWSEKCQVTFDVNTTSDIAYFLDWDYENDDEIRSSTRTRNFAKGTTISRYYYYPEQDNWDYDFIGWSVDPNAEEGDDEIVVTGNMTVYGVWREIYARVTFDANGGYFDEDDPETTTITQRMEKGYSMEAVDVYPANKFDRFLGWFDAKTGGNQYLPWETVITDDVILYAHWQHRTPTPLVLDQGTAVSSTGDEVLYSFTPAEDGAYRIYSYNHGDYEPKVVCYNSDMEEVDSDVYSRGGINFAYNGMLKAGKTYYFGVSLSEWGAGAFSFNIVIRKHDAFTVTWHLGKDISEAYFVDNDQQVSTLTRELAKNTVLSASIGMSILDQNLYLDGWSYTEGAEEPDVREFVVDRDIDLYAVWRTKHKITLKANDPEAWFEEWEYDEDGYGSTVQKKEHIAILPDGARIKDYVSRPNIIPATKTFIGWSTDPDATEPQNYLYADEDMILHAVWEDLVPVTCHANEAKNPQAYYTEGSEGNRVESVVRYTRKESSFNRWSLTQPYNPDPTLEFVGWARTPGATDPEVFTVTGPTEVYAVWKPVVTVTLHTNKAGTYFINGWDNDDNEIQESTAKVTYSAGTYIYYYNIKQPDTSNPKLRFAGWATTPNATEAQSDIVAAEGLELYAVWEDLVTVTFDTNRSDTKFKDYYTDGQMVSTLTRHYATYENLAWESFSYKCADESMFFLGWSTNKDATKPEYRIQAKEGLILYAVWEEGIKVTLHANNKKAWIPDYDGEFEKQDTAEIIVQKDTFFSQGYRNPVSDGSIIFVGWSTDPDAEEAIGYSLQLKEDTELYAVWKKAITVSYDPVKANGGYFDTEFKGVKKVVYAQGSTLRSTTVPNLTNRYPNMWFNGWSDENGKYVSENAVATEDMTLYARWRRIEATPISENQTVTVSSTDDLQVWYSFVPETTANYLFLTTGTQQGTNPNGYVCAMHDGEMYNLQGEGNPKAGLVYSLEAGQTYYYVATTHEREPGFEYQLTLTKTRAVTVTFYANHENRENAWIWDENSGNGVTEKTMKVYEGANLAYQSLSIYTSPSTHDFIGWSTDSKAKEPEENILAVNELELYAVWTVKQQTPSEGQQTPSEGDGKTSIEKATVTAKAVTYTGKALTPAPTVVLDGKTLVKDTDYTVTGYSKNTDAGTATVEVAGKGDYSGKASGTFTINKATQKLTFDKEVTVAYKGSATVKVSGAKGKLSYKSASTAVATVAAVSTGVKVTGVKYGKTTVTVTAAETTNYKKTVATTKITVKVKPAATSSLTATNLSTGVKLTWKKVTGATGYIVYRKVETGSYKKVKTISKATTVTYTDTGAKSNGKKYTFKIVPTSAYGNGTAKTVVKYYLTRPAPTLASTTAKKMKVTWKKNASATGYEIWYATDKNFKTGLKKVPKITKNTTLTKTFTLTSGKTYYVKVRSYKKVGTTYHYSPWSAVKNIKVK